MCVEGGGYWGILCRLSGAVKDSLGFFVGGDFGGSFALEDSLQIIRGCRAFFGIRCAFFGIHNAFFW